MKSSFGRFALVFAPEALHGVSNEQQDGYESKESFPTAQAHEVEQEKTPVQDDDPGQDEQAPFNESTVHLRPPSQRVNMINSNIWQPTTNWKTII